MLRAAEVAIVPLAPVPEAPLLSRGVIRVGARREVVLPGASNVRQAAHETGLDAGVVRASATKVTAIFVRIAPLI